MDTFNCRGLGYLLEQVKATCAAFAGLIQLRRVRLRGAIIRNLREDSAMLNPPKNVQASDRSKRHHA